MTTTTDIVNRALQVIGTRTTVTSAELSNNGSNEAIQANMLLNSTRDDLLRMAPWNCGLNFANLTYITSVPGTPENATPGTVSWQKGLPPPPWVYEYQYPVDCLKAIYVIPQFSASGGLPIGIASQSGAASFWQGPPVRFKVGVDQFFPVTSASPAAGGSGYAVGEIITLAAGPVNSPPIGAPVQLLVATIGVGGAVATVTVVNQISGSETAAGGSYFAVQSSPVAQGSTTGVGTGATFNLGFGAKGDQRVILSNQEFASLGYIRQITNPNVMDPMFLTAWWTLLGAKLAIALTGDKTLANLKVGETNEMIMEARKADSNEGLTVNNITPDWIRARGIYYRSWELGLGETSFDWGPLVSAY